ncbi:PREDICTED: uncharacterized protein C18orf19 homolog A-like [Priapulus caudatus]|uniref:Uncharacterized protein C18orf19 homolog A-like n=1 Tax=Priapulus caudatus TaxID=37621 RepID=A0ABM1EUG5_PRICU|nr:PREDICTED: uncharacterized protein C18orf19 homolog A-like [Priapulus caudatus]
MAFNRARLVQRAILNDVSLVGLPLQAKHSVRLLSLPGYYPRTQNNVASASTSELFSVTSNVNHQQQISLLSCVRLASLQPCISSNRLLSSKPQPTVANKEQDLGAVVQKQKNDHRFVSAELDKKDSNPSAKPLTTSEKEMGSQVEIVTVEVDVLEDKTLSTWQRLKNMYRHYWYVTIPVHCVTSCMWYGAFYVLAKNGVDIVPLLELIHTPEWVLAPIQKTGAGVIAVMFAMYKVATPARYTVTIFCTTWTITYLRKKGKIKPVKEIRQIVRKRAKDRVERAKDRVDKMTQQKS